MQRKKRKKNFPASSESSQAFWLTDTAVSIMCNKRQSQHWMGCISHSLWEVLSSITGNLFWDNTGTWCLLYYFYPQRTARTLDWKGVPSQYWNCGNDRQGLYSSVDLDFFSVKGEVWGRCCTLRPWRPLPHIFRDSCGQNPISHSTQQSPQ